ncbi:MULTISPECIES: amylo-alpha-1,6-glucosidase [unclassified Meiothermus]|uniref:amylo-alpha-1,6-glucosidase n=1 Tax=unclassified Meiothermus TaxID=370471 RepID=UPI000D7C2F19|nr:MULTISPECIES: trehalase family glycosidase [unclassified Meiothermus]PZA07259.1 neutral trehalase [Meiothermus sp. Pnk-1]RYM37993.1 neutral trehalase [Meiothermus sp. PNK-Is4]
MKTRESLEQEATRILRANDRGGFTVPTAGLYPFQWLWDAGFTALGWMRIDEARAWQELETLFRGQWESGMLPHIVFHRPESSYFPGPERWGTPHTPPTSGITQPPVVATFVRWMLEQAQDKALAEEKTRALYPKILAYHRWFKRERDPQNTGLMTTFHPWETGADNSPAWDEALARVPVDPHLPPYTRRDTSHVDPSQRPHKAEYDRFLSLLEVYKRAGYDQLRLHRECPFRVVSLLIDCVLHRANRDLLWLSQRFGFGDEAEIAGWLEASQGAIETLWDEQAGLYHNYDRVQDAPIRVGTSASFLPLYAGTSSPLRAERLVRTLESWAERVRYLVPSTDPTHPKFEPQRYWRGPVWAIMNYLIARGLVEYGYPEAAERLRQDALKLAELSGFSEYYHPTTGAGLGGGEFSWTAAMVLWWR